MNASAPQDRVITACQAVIARSNREGLAAWAACSTDTLARMLASQAESRWTRQRVRAIERYEQVVLKAATIHEEIMAEETGTAVTFDPIILPVALSQHISTEAEIIGLENIILAHGCGDAAELARLDAVLAREIAADQNIRAGIARRA